ncbi:MAG: nuclear transport factor 2 family protein [bacterium]
MSTIHRACLVSTLLCSLCLLATPVPAVLKGDIPPQLAESYMLLEDIYYRGRLERVDDLYTEDAELYVPDQDVIRGHRRIRRHWQSIIDREFADFEIEVDELIEAEDSILQIGTVWVEADHGTALVAVRFMTIWKLEDGQWKIHRDISNVENVHRVEQHGNSVVN